MTSVETLIQKLTDAGMNPVEAMALVVRAGTELSIPTRSKGAIRTERWRKSRASQTVTKRHAVTPETQTAEASPSVTDRHKASQCDTAHIYTSSLSSSEEGLIKEERKREAPPPKRASRLPADWQLDERHIDYAISKGVARERVPIIGEKFKNHWWAASGKGSTSPNWFLKWCTWVMNEVEWNGGGRNGPRSKDDRSAVAGADRVLERLRQFG